MRVQEARIKWIDAERKLIRALEENTRLRTRVFELESKLIVNIAQLHISNMQASMLLPLIFAGKPKTAGAKENLYA